MTTSGSCCSMSAGVWVRILWYAAGIGSVGMTMVMIWPFKAVMEDGSWRAISHEGFVVMSRKGCGS
jgi:hypothetical protein